MTDTARDLIQRMAKELDLYRQLLRDNCTSTHPLADEARAYLAVESEPEALTDEEILKISDQFDIDGIEDVTKGMPLDTFWDSYQPQQRIAFARAIIAADRARYGRPAIKPVPVSERPWERDGWCDGDGWCWVWNAGNCHWWEWIDSALISFAQDDYTHSLPHYALPIPTFTETP